jgi:hypothetical protein
LFLALGLADLLLGKQLRYGRLRLSLTANWHRGEHVGLTPGKFRTQTNPAKRILTVG